MVDQAEKTLKYFAVFLQIFCLIPPELQVTQNESSLTPEFWAVDQKSLQVQPVGFGRSLTFLLTGLHQRKVHTQSRQSLYLPVCRKHEMPASRSRGLQWTLAKSCVLSWVLNKYWKHRLLNWEPGFHKSQWRWELLGLIPRRKFASFGLFLSI